MTDKYGYQFIGILDLYAETKVGNGMLGNFQVETCTRPNLARGSVRFGSFWPGFGSFLVHFLDQKASQISRFPKILRQN